MGSQWYDDNGVQWRFSTITKTWQKMVGGRWVPAVVPTGGLNRSEVEVAPDVVVVESTGPRGERGERGPSGPPGTHVQIFRVLPAEFQNGVNATFELTDPADLSQAFQVFRNGLMEVPGHGFLVTPNSVTFTTPPLSNDVLTVVYQKAQ